MHAIEDATGSKHSYGSGLWNALTKQAGDDPVDSYEQTIHRVVSALLVAPDLKEIPATRDLVSFDNAVINSLSIDCKVSVDAGWKKAAKGGGDGRPLRAMVERFFLLHSRDQLTELAMDLKQTVAIGAAKTKKEAVATLMEQHQGRGVLPLPKILKSRKR